MTQGIGGWGITFVPSVIYELGMTDTAAAQVMTMPPYTLGFVILVSLVSLAACVQNKWISAFHAAAGLGVTQVICCILLVTVTDRIGKYILVMVATACRQSFFPILWPERIRAATGASAAGFAIGVTNVSTLTLLACRSDSRLTIPGLVPAHGHHRFPDIQRKVRTDL
jgi:hypothetical protein